MNTTTTHVLARNRIRVPRLVSLGCFFRLKDIVRALVFPNQRVLALVPGVLFCAISSMPAAAQDASGRRASGIRYPEVATLVPRKVIGEFNGVKIYGGGFGSAIALDPRAPGYFYL